MYVYFLGDYLSSVVFFNCNTIWNRMFQPFLMKICWNEKIAKKLNFFASFLCQCLKAHVRQFVSIPCFHSLMHVEYILLDCTYRFPSLNVAIVFIDINSIRIRGTLQKNREHIQIKRELTSANGNKINHKNLEFVFTASFLAWISQWKIWSFKTHFPLK